MEVLRVGIIGIGNMGFAHAKCVFENRVNGMKLSALCDCDPQKLESAQRSFTGVPLFSDYKKMTESGIIDAVIISTPHPLHSVMAINAFSHGLHVLVEKPADITISAAEKMNDAAQKSGKIFAIMFNQRTNPVFQQARRIVKSGQLGQLKRSVWIITNWYRTQSYYDSGSWRATWDGEGGGVLLNQAPHNLDLWQWICGMPTSVTAFCDIAKYHNIEVEDDVTLYTRYENGATGTFIASTGDCPGTNRLEITGTRGKIVLEDKKLRHWKLLRDERELCFDSNASYDDFKPEYSEYSPEASGESHTLILQNFANAVLKGEELISPGYEGINSLALSNAAYLSQWHGNREISLPFDRQEFDLLLQKKREQSVAKKAFSDITPDGVYKNRWEVKW